MLMNFFFVITFTDKVFVCSLYMFITKQLNYKFHFFIIYRAIWIDYWFIFKIWLWFSSYTKNFKFVILIDTIKFSNIKSFRFIFNDRFFINFRVCRCYFF